MFASRRQEHADKNPSNSRSSNQQQTKMTKLAGITHDDRPSICSSAWTNHLHYFGSYVYFVLPIKISPIKKPHIFPIEKQTVLSLSQGSQLSHSKSRLLRLQPYKFKPSQPTIPTTVARHLNKIPKT